MYIQKKISLQKTQKYLPSYETVSYAVKSVSQQFGWKEAVLFAAGELQIKLFLLSSYFFAGIHVLDSTLKNGNNV